MRKILLTIGFFICMVFVNAQSPTQWTLHSSAAQIRNGFNSNFSYLYSNKVDKSNPIVLGPIKISDGTNITDSAALRSWTRSYVSTYGSGSTNMTVVRSAISDSLKNLSDNALQIADVAVITADSATNKYSTKKQMRDYVQNNGFASGFLPELSSNPSSGNIYIHTGDKKIHYKIGGYWHRVAILDSVASSSSSALLTGLDGAWDLNEASGSAVDYKATNNLSIVNTVTHHAIGKNGYAYSFVSGDNSYIGGVDATYEYTNAFSISFWINTSQTGSWVGVLGNCSSTAGYKFMITDTGILRFWCYNASDDEFANSNSAINTGSWIHVVGTYDGTTIRMYINGALQTNSYALAGPIIYDSTCRFIVGDQLNSGGSGFTGSLDMVRAWHVTLSSSLITELYTIENGNTTCPW